PQYRPDKGGDQEAPGYVFGLLMAQKAEQALPYAADLRIALEHGDLGAALNAAREIENLFHE
ncbi:MAG: hypothetical protein ACRD9L_12555, partial [Bryobacteraceae bacterium]